MGSRRASTVSQKEFIANLPYFHANFKSSDEVTHFIKKKAKGHPGSFLLRPSNRNRDVLTASVLCRDNSVRHTHIQIEETVNSTKFFLVVEKKFDLLEDLIEYYRKNPVKNLEGVNHVFLHYPIERNGVISSHGSVSSLKRNNSDASSSFASGGSLSSIPSVALPPPLPNRPRTGSTSTDASSISAGRLDLPAPNRDRPPLPLPENGTTKQENLYYSQARDVSKDISQTLVEQLKLSERCECGIPRRLAELPLGWTVHLSNDEATRGKLFFQSADGVTSWVIPEAVVMQLTNTHKQNLGQISLDWMKCLPQNRSTRTLTRV